MRIEWVGGPLDGAAEIRQEELTVMLGIWVGPDLSQPDTHVVVYVLEAAAPGSQKRRYIYDPHITLSENRKRNSSP